MNYYFDRTKNSFLVPLTVTSVSEGTPGKKISGTGRIQNEVFTDIKYYQHVGFSSFPKADAVGIVAHKNCEYYLLGTADAEADRPALTDPGDVCIYTDADSYIRIKADGTIDITSNQKAITLSNGNGTVVLEANGQVNINSGNLTVDV